MSEYIAKASIEPRDYRVVFLIQKRSSLMTAPHALLSQTIRIMSLIQTLRTPLRQKPP